jgi:hypothetical protein
VGKGRSYKTLLGWVIGLGYIKNNWELNPSGKRLCLKYVEMILSDFHVLQLTKVFHLFALCNIE